MDGSSVGNVVQQRPIGHMWLQPLHFYIGTSALRGDIWSNSNKKREREKKAFFMYREPRMKEAIVKKFMVFSENTPLSLLVISYNNFKEVLGICRKLFVTILKRF